MKKLTVCLAILMITMISTSAGAMVMNKLYLNGWGGTPSIVTIADPNNTAVVGEGAAVAEGLIDPRICVAQTFKVSENQTALKLDKIAIWEAGGPPEENPFTLRLIDLGTSDPSYQGGGSQTYAAGTDLWGGSMIFDYYGHAERSALEFDFQDDEELVLLAGHYYAFELTAASPVGGLWWFRTNAAASLYPDGAAFVDTLNTTTGIRDQLFKGSNGRDLAMAVYFVPEPTTIFILSLGSLILFGKRNTKKQKGEISMKTVSVCVILMALCVPAYSDVIIGDWENGSSDGWIDWGNKKSITDSENALKYGFSNLNASLGDSSLCLTKSGWNQSLAIKLQNNGLVDEFMANNKFLIDITVPADAFFDGSGGYAQIYNVVLNAQDYGWHNMFASTPALNFYFWDGSPARTLTLEFDYSDAKLSMPTLPSYVEIILATNSSCNRGNFYIDNARLVPEPATIAFLGLGLILFRKNSK